MSTVKYDNELRDKIEGMKNVPSGFTFHPSAKWQQLENKLQPSSNKRKLVWWYWAAASLFIAFSILFWQNNTKEIAVATVPDLSKINKPQTSEMPQNTIAKQFQKQEYSSPQKKQSFANNIVINNDTSSGTEVVNKLAMAMANSQIVSVTNANMVNSIVQNDNDKMPVVIATIKPKRKVIHINEFGEAISQPILATRNEYKQTVDLQDNTLPVDANKSWWLFKAKPTITDTLTNTFITNNQ